jgi:cation diffusion facilitator CzcD-associated flavoprotein CzcO
VHCVDVKKTPIKEVVKNGIVTFDGKLHEFDIIALATGFDSVTGGIKDIELKGKNGQNLSEKWEEGTYSYLGMTTNGFPNLFWTYGAQAPTAFSNGPSCVEVQSDWIVKVLKDMREKCIKQIDAKREAEVAWRELVNKQAAATLRYNTVSWYMGTNIPGKVHPAL